MCCFYETKTRFFDDESRGLNVPRQARSTVMRRHTYTYAFRRSLLQMLALRDKKKSAFQIRVLMCFLNMLTVKSCFAGRCSGIFRLTITEVPCDTFFLHVLLLLT